MEKLKLRLTWLDKNALFIMSAFLLVFIPLFPKIPLFDILPGYIVRARPEDLLIVITSGIWIKDALQKRFDFKTTYFWIVVAFTISGVISILLGTLLLQSIPAQLLHIGKSSLHLFRYLEYFALFFFLYSSVKTKQQLNSIFALLVFTVLGVVFYGFGQEYFQFPLYSTMNREYSKGTTLYLQEGARPQSTFAGHYDLAAYLVIVLPIIFSLALNAFTFSQLNLRVILQRRSTYVSMFLHVFHILGAWMLLTSGSKTALLAYIVGIFIVLLQYLRKLGNLKQQLKWGSIALTLAILSFTLFLNFFAPTTRDTFISLVKTTVGGSVAITDPNALPEDLIGDGYVFKPVVTTGPDGVKTTQWVPEKSTWSQNALKYGLSMGIRLDTLWPNALGGFVSNPLFGKGFATLAVEHQGEFTYAESTDNNFLRTLGETGIIGFIIFYGFIALIIFEVCIQSRNMQGIKKALQIGFLSSTIGIVINATYIDVFASSKVAYTFWAFAGITLATLQIDSTKTIQSIVKHFQAHWPIYLTGILALFLLHKNPFDKNALIRELAVSNSQVESIVTARCFLETGTFSVCRNNGLVLKENFNLYSLLLVPFLKIYNHPMMFYVLNMTLFFVVTVATYVIILRILRTRKNTTSRQLLIFSSLVGYTVIATSMQYSNKPMTLSELLFFTILLPIAIIMYVKILGKMPKKFVSIAQFILPAVAILVLATSNFSTTFLNQFRNNRVSEKQKAIEVLNIHFDTNKYLNRTSDFYVMSTQNPYHVDLFSNNNYELLPFSDSQPYAEDFEKVYAQKNIGLTPEDNLYVSDYGITTNEAYSQKFQEIKRQYDLTYVAIGCDDSCNLYKVSPVTTKVSPDPQSVTAKPLHVAELQKPYSFAVISNRYEANPEVILETPQYSTQLFASMLQKSVPDSTDFVIVTGDIYHDTNEISNLSFQKLFTNQPVIYNPGNFDLLQEKYHQTTDTYFYTDSEFFLLLDVQDNSTISPQQRLFVYNALLQLEKLPEIKHVFIIAHNLNWQERSNPKNAIFDLEKKLSAFPQLMKYIITSYKTNNTDFQTIVSKEALQQSVNPSTQTYYLSTFVRNWETDSFLTFTINKDDTVTIEYKLKNRDF